MQTFVSKYLAAAQLALLAVAPLVISAFFPEAAGYVLGWMLALALVPVFCAPSRLKGEPTYAALRRVQREIARDVFFWGALAVAAYAGLRAFNVGVGVAFDSTAGEWKRLVPMFSWMPASAAGSGLVPFFGALAALLLALAARHAIGKSARLFFLVAAPLLSAAVACFLVFRVCSGDARILGWMAPGTAASHGAGLAFAVWSLAGLTGLFAAHERGSTLSESLATLAVIGNLLALTCFAHLPTVLLTLALAIVLAAVSWAMIHALMDTPEEIRLGCELGLALAVPVLFAWLAKEGEGPLQTRVAALLSGTFLPEGFSDIRPCLSGVALDVWKAHPWRGAGLGSFPVEFRFAATAADWRLVGALPASVPNGWWQLLAERGVLGAAAILLPLAPIAATWTTRLAGAFGRTRIAVASALLPAVLTLLVASAFYTSDGLEIGVLVSAGAVLALSASSVPRRLPTGSERKE